MEHYQFIIGLGLIKKKNRKGIPKEDQQRQRSVCYILTFWLLKYNRWSLKMTLIRFAVLLVLFTAGCGFVKNCQNFDPTNFALCSLCLPNFYLGSGKCYPCPANRNTIRECSVAATSLQAVAAANVTNMAQGAQNASTNGSNSSVSSQQSKKQESSTVTGAIVLNIKNESINNASINDRTDANNSNAAAMNTTNTTNNSTPTNSTPSNNTSSNNSTPSNSSQNSTNNSNQMVDFTQMIFKYLPAHCCQFKLVPVLACSACEKNYVLVNDTCVLAPPPPPAENTTSQNLTTKNTTDSVIPPGLKVTSSLITNTDSSQTLNAFIPIISPPPTTSQSFFIPIAPQFLPVSPPTTNSSNATVVMPQKQPITDSNCLTKNPHFNLSKPVSADNQRCSNCYSGFFYSLAKEQCLPLNPLCKTSDTQNRCLTCYMGYIPSKGNCVLDNGQNVTQITASSSPVKIQQIDPNCQKYQENSSVCAVCANRYYFSVTKGLCIQVDTSCKTWDKVKGYCLTCYTGYTCNANEYICRPIVVPTATSPSDPNSFKKYCLKTRNNICVSCAYRSFLSNGLCLPVSDLCQTFNANFGYCLSCYSGYTLSNGVCEQDQILNPDPNCASYNYNTDSCDQCNYNYFSNNGWCQMVSPFCNGYDSASGFCLDCIAGYNLDPQTGICS